MPPIRASPRTMAKLAPASGPALRARADEAERVSQRVGPGRRAEPADDLPVGEQRNKASASPARSGRSSNRSVRDRVGHVPCLSPQAPPKQAEPGAPARRRRLRGDERRRCQHGALPVEPVGDGLDVVAARRAGDACRGPPARSRAWRARGPRPDCRQSAPRRSPAAADCRSHAHHGARRLGGVALAPPRASPARSRARPRRSGRR